MDYLFAIIWLLLDLTAILYLITQLSLDGVSDKKFPNLEFDEDDIL